MSTITAQQTGTVPAPRIAHTELEVVHLLASDPLAAPLLQDLEREYDARYGVEVFGEPAIVEITRYPVKAFAAPNGAFLVLLHRGEPISGGAFMRYDERTAEFKRIWTHSAHRGQGLAKVVLRELEARARALGYDRVYLTTGPRQPEAVALYLGTGYTALYDPELPAEEIGAHPFEKDLRTTAPARPSRSEPVSSPSASPSSAPVSGASS